MLSSDRSNGVGTSAGEDLRPTSRVDAPASPEEPAPEDARPVVRRRRPAPPAPRWPGRLAVVMAVLACAWVTMGAVSGAWALMSVPTGSMEPNIPKGSMIVAREVPVGDVGVGDVIVFHAPKTGVLTVHRIVEVGDDGGVPVVQTRGDANEVRDPWEARLDGSSVHLVEYVVPVLGRATTWLNGYWLRLGLIILSTVLVLVGGLRTIWGTHPPPADDDGRPARRQRRPARARQIRRKRVRLGARTSLVLVLLAGALTAVMAADRANAAFLGVTGTPASIASGNLLTPTSAACRWTSGTALAVTWSLGTGGIQTGAEVIRTTLAGLSPTSVATAAPANVGTASLTAITPVTTPYNYAVRTTRSPWTSALTANVRSDECSGAVTAFAGDGTAGFLGDGGAATAARLSAPRGVAAAPDGSTYIADTANNRIRKVTAAGVISTFAGGPAASACTYAGPVASLGLNTPRGVAVDGAGNVYIADTGAACVRRVDTAGNVTRVAGGGATTTCTTATVAATALSLLTPSGLAVDGTGAVVIADTGRNCVRRISGGNATHVAGGGMGTACNATPLAPTGVLLAAPADVAVDSSGGVIIADTGRNCVRRVAGGSVTHVAGGGATTGCTTASILPTAVSLSGPESVDVDLTGRVVIADTGRRCVRLASATAVTPLGFSGTSGSAGDGGPAVVATIVSPGGVALRADGSVLVSDRSATAGSNDVRLLRTPLP